MATTQWYLDSRSALDAGRLGREDVLDLLAAEHDLAASVVHHAERADRAEAEIERLRAELAKPVLLPWLVWHRMDPTTGAIVARSTPMGWSVAGGASGPETGEEGRRLADEAAIAAGWRLL